MPKAEQKDLPQPRPTPEGVAFGIAFSQLSYGYVSILQTSLAVLISEKTKNIPPEILVDTTLALFIATLIVGYLYELGTLKKKGYVLNPATTLAYFEAHDPRVATLIGNLVGQIGFFISPVDIAFTLTSLSSGDSGRLALSNLLSRTVVGFTNAMGLNYSIREGFADKVLEKIQAIEGRLFPPNQFLDYPDNRSGDFHSAQPRNLLDT